MVIQCEVYDASKEPLEFISSEIGNKRIFCYKKYFNGKVEVSETLFLVVSNDIGLKL